MQSNVLGYSPCPGPGGAPFARPEGVVMSRPVGWSCALAVLGLVPVLSAGCSQTSPTGPGAPSMPARPPWFVDVTEQVGLDFTHDPGPIDGTYFMPQSTGSGGALLDIEN